jgi:hypothetical protein
MSIVTEADFVMSKRKLAIILSGLICLVALPVAAQMNGGRGPAHVRSAWPLDAGYFTIHSQTRLFGKISSVNNAAGPVTYWSFLNSLSFNYGVSRNFEVSFAPVLYQDVSSDEKKRNFLDDLYFFLKLGALGAKGSRMSYALEFGGRFPKKASRNVIFEPYAADKFSFGATGIMSYVRDPLYPDDGFNLHFNLGYWNHNDVGERLTGLDAAVDTVRAVKMTQELRYGVAFAIPFDRVDLRLELFGNSFIQQPPATAYTRENVTYLSPGLVYKPYRWMALDCSVDLRVSADVDETSYGANSVTRIPGLPNYSNWRLNLGLKLTVLPRSLYSVSERDVLMKKAESRRELFEQIIKERRETESAEAELEAIKEERRKAEVELARLQKLLDPQNRSEEKKPAADSTAAGEKKP